MKAYFHYAFGTPQVNLNYTEAVCDDLNSHEEVQVEAQQLVSAIQVRANTDVLLRLHSRHLMALSKVFQQ